MCCCKYIEETIISPMLYLLALGEKAQSIWLETLRVFLSFSVGVPAAFCSFSVGGKSYDYFPSLDVKKPGCRLRASHLFSQGTCPECSGSAPPPCVSLPGWRLPSLCRVQSLRMPLGGGGWFQGTSYRVGTRGSGVHGSRFGDQQASVLYGSWWCLIRANRTHSGFRSVPWGCEALSPPLLCFQMVHPCWSSQCSGGGSETEAGGWQTPQGRGGQELTVHPLSSVGETAG